MRAALAVIVLLLAAAAGYYAYREGMLPFPGEAEEAAPAEGAEPAPQQAQPLDLPRFDIVRVTRDGFAVTAGTGEPGARLDVLANGAAVDTVTIGADGAWASQVDTPLAAGPVELALRMTPIMPDGTDGAPVLSEGSIVVYVPEGDGAPIVLRTTPGGATEVLQRETDDTDALGPLAIETIDYDASNAVIVAGRASPGSAVRLFLDGVPLGGPQTADDRGRWEVSVEVPPGRYRLRAVQYDEAGQPAFAVEVPFERARDERILRTDAGVVVQPGNSLWVISRAVYGEGRQYTILFAANTDQIEDPDLIYPGQVIEVPE